MITLQYKQIAVAPIWGSGYQNYIKYKVFYSSFNRMLSIVHADFVTDEPGPKMAETPAL